MVKATAPGYGCMTRTYRSEIRRLRAEIEFAGKRCVFALTMADRHAAPGKSDPGGWRRSAAFNAEHATACARNLARHALHVRAIRASEAT